MSAPYNPKVIVGIDLKGRCNGALAWLSALSKHSDPKVTPSAVHSLPNWRAQFWSSILGQEAMHTRIMEQLGKVCDDAAPELIEEIELLKEQELPESVEFYAKSARADLLVLGRVAPKDPTPFVRLGSVTRSILQSLMLPTVVVPSDYEAQDFGPGPVMIAVDGTDTSNAAVEFGMQWAKLLGRDYFLAHVLAGDFFLGQDWLPAEELKKAQAQLRGEGQSELDRWLRSQNQEHARLELAQGNTFQELRYLATHHDACMVVTGSRCLHGTERIFNTSMSSAMASSCDRPVAVVPSTPWLQG